MQEHVPRWPELHRSLRPGSEERRWKEIPWLGDLLEARRRAAALRRPLFLWAMNGHPSGSV